MGFSACLEGPWVSRAGKLFARHGSIPTREEERPRICRPQNRGVHRYV